MTTRLDSPRRRSRRSSLLHCAAGVVLASGALHAQDPPEDLGQDLASDLEAVLSWIGPATPGCTVSVSQGGERVVHLARGAADLERGEPLTVDSRFDAGSLVKQFVAAAVLLLVEDGSCSLTDDVRRHLPELPELEHAVTIDHLLTHTSGLRDWLALQNLSRETEDAWTLVQRQRELNFVPGTEWSYSNSGYVLLKELVGRLTDRSFAEFANERLFAPLGMDATRYATSPAAVEGLALAYEPGGGIGRRASSRATSEAEEVRSTRRPAT